MSQVELLIHSANQVCVVPPHDGGPQRGEELGDLGLIEDGAVAVDGGRIVAVGPTIEAMVAREELDGAALPLLRAIINVVCHEAPPRIPWEAFFAGV